MLSKVPHKSILTILIFLKEIRCKKKNNNNNNNNNKIIMVTTRVIVVIVIVTITANDYYCVRTKRERILFLTGLPVANVRSRDV